MSVPNYHIELIEKAIQGLHYPAVPDGLYAPIRYQLSLGGKRIRPLLTLMACEMFGAEATKALTPALGIEVFHNFTLLHDDVMDMADIRRGKPTVYKVWNENTAILSGDAMQIQAYQLMSQVAPEILPQVITLFSRTALEITEGQQYDLDFEQRNDVTEEEYIEMIRLKTAVLLGCALQVGAMVAGANESDAQYLYDFGVNIGLAFQLQDDLLDVYGDVALFGKKIGGDILNNKKTYLLIQALQVAQSEQLARLKMWLRDTTSPSEEKIAAVTAIYNTLHVKELCEAKMQEYYDKALLCMAKVGVAQTAKEPLTRLAHSLMSREY